LPPFCRHIGLPYKSANLFRANILNKSYSPHVSIGKRITKKLVTIFKHA
jgi:hypothetical protein